MNLKQGDKFLHRRWVDLKEGKPLRCVVTAIRNDRVYWKQEDNIFKSKMYFQMQNVKEFVLSIIKEEEHDNG